MMTIKNLFNMAAVAATAAVLVSCGNCATVRVSNDGAKERVNETVEVNLNLLRAACPNLTADNAVVSGNSCCCCCCCKQIPSQVCVDAAGDSVLLFQVSVPAGSVAEYKVCCGKREAYDTIAYSRYVPERKDDYVYENNCMAGRIYGPALRQETMTMGSDVWVKCTSRLVVNDWYEMARTGKGSYHINHGEGQDCYKVGRSLGGGALVPVTNGEVVLGDNWATQKHLCDGPVRTEAVFTYGPFDVSGKPVCVEKRLTLDANSHFLKSVSTFRTDADSIDVALAAIQHKVLARTDGEGYIAYTEAASDPMDTIPLDQYGKIFLAVVMEPCTATQTADLGGHAALLSRVPVGVPVTSWTASGWSLGDIKTSEEWAGLVADFAYAQANPLKVEVE